MTTRLEFFESGAGLLAVRLGMMSSCYLEKYDTYLTYCEYFEKFKNLGYGYRKSLGMAISKTQEISGCDYYMVWRARKFFEEGRILQISVNGHGK